jgi:TrmH family RNA methyltransferase
LSLSRAETKKLKALQTKKGRRLNGCFLAEGVRLLEEAHRFGSRPEQVYWSPSLLSERGARLLDSFRKAGAKATEVSASELSRFGGAETSQGIAAVFTTPLLNSSELALTPHRKVLLCENISDPGNLGTLIRSAAAFDFNPVVLVGACAEPFSPKVVRASAGAIFGVTIAEALGDQFVAGARQSGLKLIATGAQGAHDMNRAFGSDSDGGIVLAIGSEADGLSETIVKAADMMVGIAHTDRVESLNAAIAGSILMKACYDRKTQRKL